MRCQGWCSQCHKVKMLTVRNWSGRVPVGVCDGCRREEDFRRGLPGLIRKIDTLQPNPGLSPAGRESFEKVIGAARRAVRASRSEDELVRRLRVLNGTSAGATDHDGIRSALSALSEAIGLKIR